MAPLTTDMEQSLMSNEPLALAFHGVIYTLEDDSDGSYKELQLESHPSVCSVCERATPRTLDGFMDSTKTSCLSVMDASIIDYHGGRVSGSG
ncbi:hypothetical protein CMUS01_15380 [Colletotrichum musicola]|uniref:Uncharacterized protein n=1 Tax=Colletotrichum musicola TaxID=2175873 RepID=A0A8H6MNJ1_9PEZI|nr:hypothetical protein CMUS01_15380 [Colletotrichum musicola]